MVVPSQTKKSLALWGGIAFLLLAAIVFLSVTPNPPNFPSPADKYGHIAGYAILMFWLMQVCKAGPSRLLIGIGLAMLGLGLEGVQAYTGYRDFERGDVLADGIGIAIGWLAGPPRTLNLVRRTENAA